MDFVVNRTGMLAALRARRLGKATGLMITASHNPVQDNGVKVTEPGGEMLVPEWESLATDITNATDVDSVIRQIIAQQEISKESNGLVVLGRDTRPSSEYLSFAATEGILKAGGRVINLGIATTPQLHFLTQQLNAGISIQHLSMDHYYTFFSDAFLKLTKGALGTVTVDCANGVGSLAAIEFRRRLASRLDIVIVNDGGGVLNQDCGADFVKTRQTAPVGMQLTAGARYCSLDGDADRLVYYFQGEKFVLLDGDRIAALIVTYLQQKLGAGTKVKMGVVQTAYANGASTNYLQSKGIATACTKTGVKHLHHAALDFDIGVYFEANGHGTILFAPESIDKLKNEGQEDVLLLANLVNQTVGDALSDMLAVEAVLHLLGWTMDDWARMYDDYPNRLMKVVIADRAVITTTNAERTCVTPGGLQTELDSLVSSKTNGRSFVRPSGTEDVVRVYAEAATKAECDALSLDVANLVYKMADGRGPKPSI